MADAEGQIRFAFNVPKELRHEIQDAAFLLKVTETDLATEAMRTYLQALKAKKGEKFEAAMKIVREAREG